MNRRHFVGLVMAATVTGSAAFAVGVADEIVRQLQADGYTDIVLETTWLGRIRIRAMSSAGTREIIVNPSTGEILRDLWIASASGSKASTLIKDPAVTPPKTDVEDEDDNDDTEDDNGGSDSSDDNSGSSNDDEDDDDDSGSDDQNDDDGEDD